MVDVVIGKVSDGFGVKLSRALGTDYLDFKTFYYPDGEAHPKILAGYEDLRGKKVLLVYRREQRTSRDEVARHIHNFTRLVGTLTDEELFGAESVDVLMPYYLMGRQDKNPRTDPNPKVRDDDKGQDVGYKYLAKAFRYNGANRILTVDPHFRREEGVKTVIWRRPDRKYEQKNRQMDFIEIHCLSVIPTLAENLRERISDDAYIVGPDGSAGSMVSKFAEIAERRVAVFRKERRDENNVVHVGEDMDVRGRDVWLVDDILSTVGTMESAIEKIKNPGQVFVVATHGVLPAIGHEKAKELSRPNGFVRGIYTSDTIVNDFETVSIIPRVAEFYEAEFKKAEEEAAAEKAKKESPKAA